MRGSSRCVGFRGNPIHGGNMPTESINRRLSRWVAGLTHEKLPPEVVDRARGVTLQGLSSCLLGHAFPETKQAISLVEEEEHGRTSGIPIRASGRPYCRL